jgi:DNA repair exonuclease SbcCD nuclease subunit
MSGETLRFLHASDLHLERSPAGLTEVPDQLRELLVEAPLQAAGRVFESAIVEDVDFVLLAGDVIDPQTAGPRAVAFLLEQLALLHEQRIPVYWAAGRVDAPERWPQELCLPDTVKLLPQGQLQELTHRRHDQPVASIFGMSSPDGGSPDLSEFRIEPTNRFTIALAYGHADASSLAAHKHIDYWALGSAHQAKTLFQSPQTACYPGSPQGRTPAENGVHGCLLVQTDRQRKVQTKFLPTDAIRWHSESLALPENTHRNDLQRHLRGRMQRIAAEANGVAVLVEWKIQTDGGLGSQLRAGLDRELADWMRTEFGRAQPAIWTTDVTVETAAALPEEAYEEDTILGDFLRAVREHQQDEKPALNLAAYLPEQGRNRTLAAILDSADQSSRGELLAEAALLGAELLRGEEILPAGA